jgi:two-component system response regulator AtoC
MSDAPATLPRILVVDDRAEARTLVAGDLANAGFRVSQAEDGAEGWLRFRRDSPDVVVTDLRMPRSDGIELLGRIRSVSNVPVLLLTAYGDVPTAVAAMKGGAQEYLHFPDDLGRLVPRVRELAGHADSDAPRRLEDRIAGRCVAVRRVRERIRALAPLRLPVLICGERGSGRDTVAEALHAFGERPEVPLTPVRCGAGGGPEIPAGGAVIYLDDVESLSASERSHWLRVLRNAEASPDDRLVRVLASTREDLSARAASGHFDPGLAEILTRFSIALPPLRERREDVAQLVPILAARAGERLGRAQVRFDRGAIAALRAPLWPGNVAELASVIEKLVAFSVSGSVSRDQVREVLGESPDGVAALRSRRNRNEREELIESLEACGGNLAEVARRIGISRGAVIYRAQKHGLVPKPT